jgi:hypothetical protein
LFRWVFSLLLMPLFVSYKPFLMHGPEFCVHRNLSASNWLRADSGVLGTRIFLTYFSCPVTHVVHIIHTLVQCGEMGVSGCFTDESRWMEWRGQSEKQVDFVLPKNLRISASSGEELYDEGDWTQQTVRQATRIILRTLIWSTVLSLLNNLLRNLDLIIRILPSMRMTCSLRCLFS